MKIPFSEHDVEELVRRFDTNGDGFISFESVTIVVFISGVVSFLFLQRFFFFIYNTCSSI